MRSMLRLFDTLSGAVRPFEPSGAVVTLYVCGVTPYDTTHLGHAFTFVSFDVLIRYLRYRGQPVRYVQNVTDLDDPLFKKAEQLGIPYQELAIAETERYIGDMRAVNALPPDVYPHASREIPEMIELVERLIQTDHAYVVDGYVYFSVASDPEYGMLSKLGRDEMIETARQRGGDPDDPRRRDPLDFTMWRESRPGEPRMPSPWGAGLPGWHIECSAMALKYLGVSVDIHGGGSDLIFPHHESEIAQSESATGSRPLARFWMHTGMVYLAGEKMSKSLGNMVFVRDLVSTFGADALRLYLSASHYRAQLRYDESILAASAVRARDLFDAARDDDGASSSSIDVTSYRDRFVDRMNDDLDTPGAIIVVLELADAIQRERSNGCDTTAARRVLRESAGVLGLRLEHPAN